MVDAPGLTLSAQPSDIWKANGPLASRVLDFAAVVTERLTAQGVAVEPAAFEISQAPPEHAGLGVGTQLGLGVARLICARADLADPSVPELARLSGRGLRSGIGLHGFALGGLIVDGGRVKSDGIPPLLTRLEFPSDWSILIVIPRRDPGLHGLREVQAFSSLPPSPDSLTDALCRLVLLGLLPAVVERDLPRFGEALEEIQRRVGEGFAPAQGGIFARPESEHIIDTLKQEGLRGIGQSSWGPTLYGFSDASPETRNALLERLQQRLGLEPGTAFWTRASGEGASMEKFATENTEITEKNKSKSLES
jgi:beta-RFAP synthase